MPAPADIDEELSRLERDIRQYKIECEQYFGGGRKRPPTEFEWRIENTLKRYLDRGAELSYRHRFHMNNLAQTYAKFKDVNRKRMQKHEEGKVERHFGAAARAIEAERARRRKSETVVPAAVTCSDPSREPRKLDQVYAAYREAVQRTGESSAQLSADDFKKFLCSKADQLRKQNGNQAVEFVVTVEGGKARLKARVCASDQLSASTKRKSR